MVYHAKCAEESCNDDYVGETARPISERVLNQSGRDKNFQILKHQIEKEHPCPQCEDFKVISSGFRNNTKKRKLSEALWINTLRPSLNKQEKSIPLKLFNYYFSSVLLLIYLFEVSILTLAICLCWYLFDNFGQLSSWCIVSYFAS